MGNPKQSIVVIAWNVENLFHPQSGGPRQDYTEADGWTMSRYKEKVKRITRVLREILVTNGGTAVPAIIGLSEVEDQRVALDILKGLPKRFKLVTDNQFAEDYADTVLFYDSSALSCLTVKYLNFFERFKRGEVLQVQLKFKQQPTELTIYLCHLKSRSSSKAYTEVYRQATCDNIQSLIWHQHGGKQLDWFAKRLPAGDLDHIDLPSPNVLVMGDFNDEPYSPSLTDYLFASFDKYEVLGQLNPRRVLLYNTSWEGLKGKKPGTNYYDRGLISKWSMLDQIVVSPSLLERKNNLLYKPRSFRIISEFTQDNTGKPHRICNWDEDNQVQWNEDGYSDHFPILIKLELR